ncbi:MAG: acyltransferase family protein [Pseudomonadota bacterium]
MAISSKNPASFYHPKYRSDIDGLRAIAIMSVVCFHAYPSWLPGGFVGVDIFFVISGYLISVIIFKNLSAGTFSFGEFYMRRVKRIFPALIVVLSACYLYGWMTLFADEYKQVGKHIAAGAFFVSNIALWFESGYFDTAAETKPLLHLWSLGVEEQFYIFWPILAVVLWRQRSVLPWVVGAIFLLSFITNILFIETYSSAVFYLPATRIWELLTGVLLAYVVSHTQRTNIFNSNAIIGNILSIIGIVMLVVAFTMINQQKDFPGWWASLPVLGTCILIMTGGNAWANRLVLSRSPLVWFGLISYPLYLWHWPVLSYFRMTSLEPPSLGERFVLVVISICLAWLTYQYIEKPVRFGKKKIVSNKSLVIIMFIVGVVGYTTYDNNGFTSREANHFGLEASYDWPTWYRLNSCFIETKSSVGKFSKECDGGTTEVRHHPLVLLWGDSHAASLYPGLKKYTDLNGFRLAQYTSNGCPPVLGFIAKSIEPQCRDINDYVLHKIQTLKPDMVVMAGFWSSYNGSDGWAYLEPEMLSSSLEQVLNELKNVVVVGQLPISDIAQPHIAARAFKPSENNRTFYHFNDSSSKQNKQLGILLGELDVRFVSPTDLLCNERGCLISTTVDVLNPVAWDYGHLTKAGSELLVDLTADKGLLKFSD